MTINISDILKLRPLKFSDTESIAHYANNINIWKNLTDMFPHPYTLNDAERFIESQKGIQPTASFAIVLKNEAIGVIGISVNNEDSKLCGDIGYWIAENFWNQGIATSVIKVFIKYGFETFKKVDCISASVFIENIASLRALEKSGLKQEKLIKNAILKAGEKKDIYFYRLTRKNYNEFRSI